MTSVCVLLFARSLSVACLSAWHRATPSLLYIQLLGAAHDKRYCIFISTSRSEFSRIRGFLTTRHEHTLTFLITYSFIHIHARLTYTHLYIYYGAYPAAYSQKFTHSRVYVSKGKGVGRGEEERGEKSMLRTRRYKIHVYIVAAYMPETLPPQYV